MNELKLNFREIHCAHVNSNLETTHEPIRRQLFIQFQGLWDPFFLRALNSKVESFHRLRVQIEYFKEKIAHFFPISLSEGICKRVLKV